MKMVMEMGKEAGDEAGDMHFMKELCRAVRPGLIGKIRSALIVIISQPREELFRATFTIKFHRAQSIRGGLWKLNLMFTKYRAIYRIDSGPEFPPAIPILVHQDRRVVLLHRPTDPRQGGLGRAGSSTAP
jgi:hypothetical protein